MTWSDLGLGGSGMSGTSTASRSGSTAIARGRIQIDIDSSQARVQTAARSMGQALKSNLGGGTREGVQQAKKEIESLNSTLQSAASKIGTLFATRSIFQATQQVNQLATRFKLFVGEGEAANAQMKQLREYAKEVNAPLLDVLDAAAGIAPSLKDTNAELSKVVDISQRLRLFDPSATSKDATIALREFISGDYISLSRRFEIDRRIVQDMIKQANGDVGKQLDLLDAYLNKLGATSAALGEMNEQRAFERLQDSGQRLMATVFNPLISDFVLPLVDGMSDLIDQTNEWNSELANTALVLAGIAATSKGLGMGKLGMAGTAIYAGVQVGVAGSRLAAEQGVIDKPELENVSQAKATEIFWEQLRQSFILFINGQFELVKRLVPIISLMAVGAITLQNGWDRIKTAVDIWVTGLQLVAHNVRNNTGRIPEIILDGATVFKDAIDLGAAMFLDAIGGLVNELGEALKDIPLIGGIGDDFKEAGDALKKFADVDTAKSDFEGSVTKAGVSAFGSDDPEGQRLLSELGNLIAKLENSPLLPDWSSVLAITEQLTNKLAGAQSSVVLGIRDVLFGAKEPAAVDPIATTATGAGIPGVSEEILEAYGEFQDDLKAIDDKAHEEREQAEAEHQQKISDTINDFEQQRERDAQDEARRREKAEADRDASIAEVNAAFDESELDRIAKHNADKEKAERDHNRALEDAAASLDGKRVFDLQQGYEDQETEREAAFNAETEENIRQRDARIQAIRDEFTASEAERAAERQVRLDREKADHEAQLLQLEAQHNQKLAQIDSQADKERQIREQKFIEQNNALTQQLGNHNNTMILTQRAGLAQLEADYVAWLGRMQAASGQLAMMEAAQSAASGVMSSLANIQPFAVGGTMLSSGLVHAERGETIIPSDLSRFMRRQLGGAELNASSLAAMATGANGGGRHVQFGDVHVPTTNVKHEMSPNEWRAFVIETFIQIMEGK